MIIFDTETTGLVKAIETDIAKQPRIIEYFGLKVDDNTLAIEGELDLLIYPGEQITEEITGITKITNEMLVGKPVFAKIYDQLFDFHLGQRYICGHNVMFDKHMMLFEMRRIGKEYNFPWCKEICTVEQTERYEGRRLKLADLYKLLTGNTMMNAHRARNDVMATYECILAMKERGDWEF